MPFFSDELGFLAAKAAEYKLISDLASDPWKRFEYEWLASEMRDLVKRAEAQRTQMTAPGAANPSPRADG
jgi:hypothetical protein